MSEVQTPNIYAVLAALRALEETPEVKAYLALRAALEGKTRADNR